MEKWYDIPGENDSVVISSRVRLARNLAGLNFEGRIGDADAGDLIEKIADEKDNIAAQVKQKLNFTEVETLSDEKKQVLMERHLISQSLADKKMPAGLIASEDDGISIMINEDDHLRIQCVKSGSAIDNAYILADKIDDYIGSKWDYSFDNKYGYLTSSLSDCGTGLKASFLLFLPGISLANRIQKLADEVGKFGIAIRGSYGEGTKSEGFIYQLTSTRTLGVSEHEIMDNISQIVLQIVDQENKLRKYILSNSREEIADKIFRSYGVLRYAKSLSTQDATMMLSQLKLGQENDIIKFRDDENIYGMMVAIRQGSIQEIAGRKLGKVERDRFRANYLNKRMSAMELLE